MAKGPKNKKLKKEEESCLSTDQKNGMAKVKKGPKGKKIKKEEKDEIKTFIEYVYYFNKFL